MQDYLQPLDVGRNPVYDEMKDDGKICSRDCTRYSEPRICYYKFVAEQYHAMGPCVFLFKYLYLVMVKYLPIFLSFTYRACKNCPLDREDCFSPQCITGDGIERTVLSFNRLLPGPAVHVSNLHLRMLEN